MTTDERDGPLARWSRRKRAARAGEGDSPVPAPAPVHDAAAEAPELSEEEYLAQHGLATPEEMQEGADFTAFMKSGVPDALRRRALRRLWRVNPVLANLDGLLDYGEDFTDAAMVPDVVVTAFKVGRGFRPDPDEPAAEAAPTPIEQPDTPADRAAIETEDAPGDMALHAPSDGMPDEALAEMPDAALDAAPDAALDAALDAPSDGAPDAALDAPVPRESDEAPEVEPRRRAARMRFTGA